MSFFDPNDNSSFDPATFNYGAAQKQLELRQALAKNLMQQKVPDGQMVSGWYVAPNWKTHLASALANIAGAYALDKTTGEGQKQLDANSIEAFKYQMNNQPQASFGQSYDANQPMPMGPPTPDMGAEMGAVSNPQGQVTMSPNQPSATTQSALPASTGSNQFPPVPNQNSTLMPGPLSQTLKAQGPTSEDKVVAPGTFEPVTDMSRYGVSGTPVQTATPPSIADTMAWAAKLSHTGKLGAGIAQNMIAKQFPNYDIQLDKDNGKVIMVDKNNPANIKTISYTGEGPTKAELEKKKLIADTDKTKTETGTGLGKAQSETLAAGQKEQANIAAYDKSISELQRMAQLSASVGSRFPAFASLSQLFSSHVASDPEINELKQLFAANTMETAKAALAGSGRLGQNEYKAFQEATPSITTNPTAVANLAQRAIQTLQAQKGIANAVLGEHKRIYGSLGGNSSIFDDHGLPQAGSPSTGAVPGYKQSIKSPYSQ